MRFRNLYLAFVLVIAVIITAGCSGGASTPGGTAAPAPASKIMGWATSTMGSGNYIWAAALAGSMEKYGGLKLKNIPIGSELARLVAIQKGEVTIANIAGPSGVYAAAGTFDFSAPEWGPQRIRSLWRTYSSEGGFIVRGDSGIKTGADLKGKRIAYPTGFITLTGPADAMLAFHGLTWNDVTRVTVASSGAGYTAVINGTADATAGFLLTSAFYELQASPHGIGVIPLPFSNTAGWAILRKAGMFPAKLSMGVAAIEPKIRGIEGGAI
ncbi:MAG: TAXI family TRAP transporter solute-binding subunit, partial [Dehalococcoidia bacterium]|nr:TAXI family TRAP transporter solute-binding subunit [Dehalococcoidia bacterium]